jgi:serine acetyltransferase
MTALWSDIRTDIEFRHHLLYPGGSGLFGWLRASLLSRGTLALAAHRLTRYAKDGRHRNRRWSRPLGWLVALARRAVLIVAKVHVASSTRIAPGVCLPDGGHLVLGALEVGPGTIIQRNVTIGMGLLDGGRPRIGANVLIGSDCVIYGAIVIGDGATLRPGSVVTRHIPARAVVEGNPPRVIATELDNSSLRASFCGRCALAGALPLLLIA